MIPITCSVGLAAGSAQCSTDSLNHAMRPFSLSTENSLRMSPPSNRRPMKEVTTVRYSYIGSN